MSDQILANFDKDEGAPTGALPFISSVDAVAIAPDNTIRLALTDQGSYTGLFADVTVLPHEMQFTLTGPALGWTLTDGRHQIHKSSMSITSHEHVDGQATLYLTCEGQPDMPIARLIAFDSESGEHMLRLSANAKRTNIEQRARLARIVA